ncbi:HAD-IC family P-type ATPase [Streptomyces sp. NPDC102462]|uniref:HAD-IC family P-type ATPase n=1 Tax=Streptomyces sp. NPDC102462 TaxID=3366178 RepID=UPI00382FD7FD
MGARSVTTPEAAEQAGGTGTLPDAPVKRRPAHGAESAAAGRETDRLPTTVLLALPVLVLSTVPGLQFRNWQWLCFVLAAPVAAWSAWPFHVRAVRGLRRSAITVDTLVSLGVAASFSWSAYALFLGGAGDPGIRTPFGIGPYASAGVAHLYLHVAVGVPLFVLAGRHLEAAARQGTGAPPWSLAALRAGKGSARDGDGRERPVPGEDPPVRRPADRVAGVLVPVALALAVTTSGFWLGAGADPRAAVTACVALLVVACPMAVGLATPTAVTAATGRGARLGVSLTAPRTLETGRPVDAVVLGTTGTLTSGRMSVARVTALPGGLGRAGVLRLAGAVEQDSRHPLGEAIAGYARREVGEPLPEADALSALPGRGVRGRVDGRWVEVRATDEELPAGLPAREATAHTPVLVYVDEAAEALIEVGEVLRPGGYRAVDRLRRLGVRPVLATGDREAAAHAVAEALGIDEVHARCTPEDKADLVRDLQREGHRVAVVADGVHDVAALAAADLGIALGGAADAAVEAADVTLVRGDIEALADAVALVRRTSATVRANLLCAFGQSAVTVPLAMVGLLNPLLAAAAAAAGSVLVVANSLRLRAWSPSPVRRRTR